MSIGAKILSGIDGRYGTYLEGWGIETVFTMRAVRIQLLMQVHREAIAIADRIIEGLEAAI